MYKEILRFDPYDDEALAFFKEVGSLDLVMDELSPMVEVDLLANIVLIDGSTPQLPDKVTGHAFQKEDGRLSYVFEEDFKLVMKNKDTEMGVYRWRFITAHSLEVIAVEPARWHVAKGIKEDETVGTLLLIDENTLKWQEGNPALYIRVEK